MTKAEQEMEEYGKRLLAPLRAVPPNDQSIHAEIRQDFLRQGEVFREQLAAERSTTGKNSSAYERNSRVLPWLKLLAGALTALIILVGSAVTVSASQSSLPGDPLYALKSVVEDFRLKISPSPQTKLELTLEYTDRRMGEISSLLAKGKSLPGAASDRYKSELESALQLAAQMDDIRMKYALGRIKHQAENQGMTIEELMSMLPEQATPAISHLQQRLQEQVELSNIGETDPRAFRSAIHEREKILRQPGSHKSTPANDSSTPASSPSTGTQEKPGNGNSNKDGKPSTAPGHDGSNTGNSGHDPNKTPEP